jgi:hypothetical protein
VEVPCAADARREHPQREGSSHAFGNHDSIVKLEGASPTVGAAAPAAAAGSTEEQKPQPPNAPAFHYTAGAQRPAFVCPNVKDFQKRASANVRARAYAIRGARK